jgi:hypothetical protein
MTVRDDLLKLKTAITAVTATENGWTTLTRDATTGQVVVQIDKCPAEGIPVVVTATADTGTSAGGGTHVVTIEASDTLATGYITVATFPTITQVAAKQVAVRMVRRVATQKKYLRSVITRAAAGDSSISRLYEISIGVGLVDDDASY